MSETIAAVSTPPGYGAIGIVRLSGPEAYSIARQLFTSAGGQNAEWQSHRAYFGVLKAEDKTVDHCLMLYMQGPRSFTGEDIVEFQCHGGQTLIETVLRLCLAKGARAADPGEFSQRAFLNGKLDLTQAEAIMDLIHSPSQQGVYLAAHQLEGHLSKPIRAVRESLLSVLASIEANIDFPDEVDPPDLNLLQAQLIAAQAEIDRLLATADAGRIWRQGLKLAIIGEPNVGKSTLLNQLLRYERAIVSEIPGTTRDTIEDDYNLRGIPIRLIDTAGLRETEDQIESIGIARTQKALQAADLVLVVIDARQSLSLEIETLLKASEVPWLLVCNKQDLLSESLLHPDGIGISALNGAGLESLEEQLFQRVSQNHVLNQEISINDRHRVCLLRAQEALDRLTETIKNNLPTDFWSIDMTEAIQAFGEILGQSVAETVIDEVFHRFCVGK